MKFEATAILVALIIFALAILGALRFQSNEAMKLASHPERLVGPQTQCTPGDLAGARQLRCYETRGPAERIPSPF